MLRNGTQRYAEATTTFGQLNREKSPRLLIIDDVAVHRMIICKMATKAGLLPFEAESCGDVVRLTTTSDFECATLDLSLGERAGTEVLRHFSICGFSAPIVIVSGSDTTATEHAFRLGKSLGLNMLEPVGKPVDLTKLRAIFATLVTEPKGAQLSQATAT